ncbi:MAG: hypothetical protein BRD24_04235 [Halobacteriales archaeon SW_9_67_24]|nr:MAG: hypothetical protein BRD24_04235 [Halobacteriales archaeon SW_9_67_24]
MFAMTAVKKAATYGYKKYGIPGAIVTGLGTLLGVRFIKGKFLSRSGGDGDDGMDVSGESDDGGSSTAD